MISTFGITQIFDLDPSSRVQHIQGIVHATATDVARYIKTNNRTLKATQTRMKLRESSANGSHHLISGHGPLGIIAGIAADIQQTGLWQKNAAVPAAATTVNSNHRHRPNAIASSNRAKDRSLTADEKYRLNFGDDAYQDYRASLDRQLESDLAKALKQP